ncbi:MAG: hypothetical protein ACYC91_00975 [Solirubrobacteraceae bacterium]
MPTVAIVTLIGVALLVAVLAGYLIRVAVILRHVVSRLNTILSAVGGVIQESAPIGDVATAINADLDTSRRALEGALEARSQAASGQASSGVGAR